MKRKAAAVSVPSGVEVWRARLRKITEAAAAKLKAEAAEKEKKVLEKQQQLARDAAVEFLRHAHGGKKEKPAPDSLQEKLRKACRCHLTHMLGLHKDKCSCRPANLHAALRQNVANRASIEQQLRTRTSLTPKQREAALDHLFGADVVLKPFGCQGGGGI